MAGSKTLPPSFRTLPKPHNSATLSNAPHGSWHSSHPMTLPLTLCTLQPPCALSAAQRAGATSCQRCSGQQYSMDRRNEHKHCIQAQLCQAVGLGRPPDLSCTAGECTAPHIHRGTLRRIYRRLAFIPQAFSTLVPQFPARNSAVKSAPSPAATMRRAAVFLLGLLALGAVAEASKLGDAIKERLDDLPKVTAQDGGRPLVCPVPWAPYTATCVV